MTDKQKSNHIVNQIDEQANMTKNNADEKQSTLSNHDMLEPNGNKKPSMNGASHANHNNHNHVAKDESETQTSDDNVQEVERELEVPAYIQELIDEDEDESEMEVVAKADDVPSKIDEQETDSEQPNRVEVPAFIKELIDEDEDETEVETSVKADNNQDTESEQNSVTETPSPVEETVAEDETESDSETDFNEVVVVDTREESLDKDTRPEVVHIEDITKTYHMGDFELQVLKGISLTIREGEFISIMGPSGSGKSTLMNILGLLDEPSSGDYRLDDKDAAKLSESQRAILRNQKIGFVFQNFNLLKRTTALQQVELPLIYGNKRQRSKLAREALEAVGLGQRLDHTPAELSGGQQQRVAIARALVTQPSLILADEPTGNLDSKSGTEVMQLFQRLNREEGKTTIFVTHDSWIARHTDRVIMLRDGQIIADQHIDEPLIAGETERPSGAGQLQAIFDQTYYEGEESEFN